MDPSLQARLSDLRDLELALLVSVVAGEHCIFSAAMETPQDFTEEVRLTCMETFGWQPAVINCNSKTTVDDFNEALLVKVGNGLDSLEYRDLGDVRSAAASVDVTAAGERTPKRVESIGTLNERRIAKVVIATGLDTAAENVQVQAFELLRSKRIFTRSSMHVAPKDLLFIVILSRPEARLYRHLNDLFCISHIHTDDDGLPHISHQDEKTQFPSMFLEDIELLRELMENVILTAQMAQYVHNIVVFMRNSRYVKSGVTATATRQLRALSRALAPIHGMDYVPPSLVALAARKIYPHRLVLVTTGTERSLLWGSDPEAIKELLQDMAIDDVIEEVLASVETPL